MRKSFVLLLSTFYIVNALQIGNEDGIKKERPNLVVIMTDEHNLRTISAYRDYYLSKYPKDEVDVWGRDIFVHTPNIDSLAKEGAMFTNYYTPVPQCTPSRTAFLTGMYPFKTKADKNWGALEADTPTWSKVLLEEGYATSYMGKFHLDGKKSGFYHEMFGENNSDRNFGFADNKYRYNTGEWKLIKEDAGEMKTFKFVTDANAGDDLSEIYATDFIVNRGIEYIESKANQDEPFALFLSLTDPHGPDQVRSPYDTMYKDLKFSIPRTTRKYRKYGTPNFYGQRGKDFKAKNGVNLSTSLDDIAKEMDFQETMTQYFGMVKLLDDKLGELFRKIKNLGIEHSTIICFCSDHGDLAFEHGRLQKQEPYLTSAGIPMIMKYPGKIKTGKVIETAYSAIDFAPSILSIMGLSDSAASISFDGVDGSEEIMNDDSISKDEEKTILLYYHTGRWCAAFRNGYKLILNSLNRGPDLFDLNESLDELANVVVEKAYNKITRELYALITSWIKDNNFLPSAGKSFTNASPYCKDSPMKMRQVASRKEKIKSCAWVARNPGVRCRKNKGAVATHCPETCRNFYPCSCTDSRKEVLFGDETKFCYKIEANDCEHTSVKDTCRETCGACDNI